MASRSSGEPKAPEKRRQVLTACVPCRISHRCCDEPRPCKRCRRLQLNCLPGDVPLTAELIEEDRRARQEARRKKKLMSVSKLDDSIPTTATSPPPPPVEILQSPPPPPPAAAAAALPPPAPLPLVNREASNVSFDLYESIPLPSGASLTDSVLNSIAAPPAERTPAPPLAHTHATLSPPPSSASFFQANFLPLVPLTQSHITDVFSLSSSIDPAKNFANRSDES